MSCSAISYVYSVILEKSVEIQRRFSLLMLYPFLHFLFSVPSCLAR